MGDDLGARQVFAADDKVGEIVGEYLLGVDDVVVSYADFHTEELTLETWVRVDATNPVYASGLISWSTRDQGSYEFCVGPPSDRTLCFFINYNNGTQLAFVLYGTEVLQLMLANNDWMLGDIPEYDINIQVDDTIVGTFTARSTRDDTLLIQFGARQDILQAMGQGKFLVVNPGPEALVYSLTDTQDALGALQNCVKTGMTPAHTRNPFAKAERKNPFSSRK